MALKYIVNHDTLKASLTSWWSMGEVSGERADAVGSYPLTDGNTVGSTTGLTNRCASFVTANNEYFNAGDQSAFDITTSLNASFFCWVKIDGNPASAMAIAGKWKTAGGNDRNWLFRVETDGTIKIFAGTGASTSTSVGSVSTVTDNAWHLVGFTFDSSDDKWRLFIDSSTADATSATVTISSTAATMGIGAEDGTGSSGSADQFDGLMQNAGWWTKVVSTSEIDDLHNSSDGMTYGIDFDKSDSLRVSSDTSVSFSLAAEGTNSYAVLYACLILGDNLSNITVDSVSATFVWKKQVTGTNQWVYCYVLKDPPTSSVVYEFTQSGAAENMELHALLYSGVDQTNTPDSNATGSGGNTTWTISTTTVGDYAWLSSAGRNIDYGNVITASTGTIERETDVLFKSGDSDGAKTPAGSHSNVWTDGGSFGDTYGGILSLAPASEAAAVVTFIPKIMIY